MSYPKSFTLDDVFQVLRNMGHDVDCGACIEFAFTGHKSDAVHTCSQTADRRFPIVPGPPVAEAPGINTMVYVDGSKVSFRCPGPIDSREPCGCNVFRRRGDRYTCNSCGERFIGES